MENKNLMISEKSKKIQRMFDKISPRYDFMNRLLSFRQDIKWRKALLAELPSISNENGHLIDVATGTGDIIFSCAEKRKDYKVLCGVDISAGMLSFAEIRKSKHNLKNTVSEITFEQGSAEDLPFNNNQADALTISFGFRNVDNRQKALQEFYRVIKPGGKLLILEFFPSKSTIFKKIFEFYFHKILPKIGGWFSDKEAYQYLPQSVASMPTCEEFKVQLGQIGFTEIKTQDWLAGSTVLFSCQKT